MEQKKLSIQTLPDAVSMVASKLEQLLQNASMSDVAKIDEALIFANKAHEGQKRKSGEPYIIHPIEVAVLAQKMGLDPDAVCAALLHDVVEDTSVRIQDVEARFGKSIAQMVDALTKIEGLKMVSEKTKAHQAKAETLRKMMLAMSRDIRVILVKLCDRLHNLKTIEHLAPEKRRRIAIETKEIYAPIASRLGLDSVWNDLMDMSFRAIHPWRCRVIEDELEKAVAHRKNHIRSTIERIAHALEEELGGDVNVSGRRKRAHSIYTKMREKKLRFKDVLDREGFRVVVEKKSHCYLAIGILHELWKPIPGFFKDYIAIPKVNGYQSLHTALLNEHGDPMEIQIRTKQMHARAEDGVASHWIYKSKGDDAVTSDGWVWLQSLLDIQASSSHAEDYLEHVKTDLLSDEVYVFTPSGEVIGLPRGASVLDFSFGIHSDVGLKAVGATVNGEVSGLSKRLRSGDIVSIATGTEIQVQPMWLSFAKTGRAKAHIRSHLRIQELPKSIAMGTDLLLHALSQLGVSRETLETEKAWAKASKRFGGGRSDILALIGRGSLSALAVAQVLGKGSRSAKAAGGLLPILIGGEESESVKMAHCCSPLPPQAIVGALGQEFGMLVHRRDCAAMQKSISKGQHVEVAWEEAALTQSFSTSLKVKAKNQRGTLGRLAALIASKECDVNNVRVTGNSVEDNKALIDFDIQVRSKFHLDRVVEALAKADGVVNVF